jgi:hypothetical protein
VKHVSQERRVHFEARLVEAVCHDSEHILNEGKQVLLVESLSYVVRFANVLE